MNIAIIGLGLMGGSLALSLKKQKYGKISAIDGKIICTGTGAVILDFKNDSGRWIQTTTDKTYGGTIAQRNSGLGYA